MGDDGEGAPPGGSAEAGVAATRVLDDGEGAPPGGSDEASGGAAGAASMPKQMTIPYASSCTRVLTPSFSLNRYAVS